MYSVTNPKWGTIIPLPPFIGSTQTSPLPPLPPLIGSTQTSPLPPPIALTQISPQVHRQRLLCDQPKVGDDNSALQLAEGQTCQVVL